MSYVYFELLTFCWPMSENGLLPCGFLRLPYLNFKAFQSKLDIETIVFFLKNDSKMTYFKTTTTMVSTNFKMDLIFDERIIDEHIE